MGGRAPQLLGGLCSLDRPLRPHSYARQAQARFSSSVLCHQGACSTTRAVSKRALTPPPAAATSPRVSAQHCCCSARWCRANPGAAAHGVGLTARGETRLRPGATPEALVSLAAATLTLLSTHGRPRQRFPGVLDPGLHHRPQVWQVSKCRSSRRSWWRWVLLMRPDGDARGSRRGMAGGPWVAGAPAHVPHAARRWLLCRPSDRAAAHRPAAASSPSRSRSARRAPPRATSPGAPPAPSWACWRS